MANAPLLALRQASLCVGADNALFENANLSIDVKERICIVGRNGAGKSSLLKLINGELVPDKGQIEKQSGLKVAKLEQTIPSDLSGTVFDAVVSGLEFVGDSLVEYEHLVMEMETSDSPDLLDRFYAVSEKLDSLGAWEVKSQVEALLSKMSLSPHQAFDSLSGGYIRRVLLAKALVSDPDILLLDEPTNHLDIDTIQWLEKTILDIHKTILFVSHDRKFLQNIATKIVEIDNGDLVSYSGNFDSYLKQKAARLAAQEKANALFDKRLSEEEVWIRQGIKARRTRDEGRVRRLEAMRKERSERRERQGTVKMQQQTVTRTGKHIFELDHVSFAYPDRTVLSDFSALVQKGDKIGILGPNGCGKSTLLKLLMQQLEPTSGVIKPSVTLDISYFDQKREQLDHNKTIIDNITDSSEMITIGDRTVHVMTYLQDFLFTPARARTAVSVLSGGEKHRLLLAKLFTKPSNVLILDEPTNDLDIETLEVLEERVLDYAGTVIIVSHDRQFLDNVATHLWVYEGEGKLSEYIGGYEDYLRQRPAKPALLSDSQKKPQAPVIKSIKVDRATEQQNKKELNQLTKKIEDLELKIEQLHALMAESDFYELPDYKQKQSQSNLKQLESDLAAAYNRWEELE